MTDALATLALLIGLEMVLGVDNVLVIATFTGRLPEAERNRFNVPKSSRNSTHFLNLTINCLTLYIINPVDKGFAAALTRREVDGRLKRQPADGRPASSGRKRTLRGLKGTIQAGNGRNHVTGGYVMRSLKGVLSRLPIKGTDGSIELIEVDSIFYLEAKEGDTLIRTKRKKLYHSVERLSALEKKLPRPPFVRCHREFMVNLNRVRAITARSDRDEDLRLDPPVNRRIPIARDRLPAVRRILGL